MSAEQKSKRVGAFPVSKKMLVALVAMLVVIFVPVATFALETSNVKVIIRNIHSESAVSGELWLPGTKYGISEFTVDPGEQREWSYPVRPGTYAVTVRYWFSDMNYSRYFGGEVHVLPFQTDTEDIVF